MSEYAEKILEAYKQGKLNQYMVDRLLKAVAYGVDSALVDELLEDGQNASDHGIESDNDYNLYFFTRTCMPDILKDTFGLDPNKYDQKSLRSYILDHKNDNNYNLKNLIDHRLLIHQWLVDQLDKKAYPNTGGKTNKEPEADLGKWIDTLKDIYAALHKKKMNRTEALDYFTADWDPDERQKFSNWMRYYESGTTEKYNVKNASTNLVKDAFGIPQSWMNQEDRAGDGLNMTTVKPPQKTERELKQEEADAFRRKIKSRLRALRRLVDRYNDALPHQDLDSVYNEMNALDRSVSRLNVRASMEDVLVRSANRIRRMGFEEGAEFLYKIAQDEPIPPESLPAPMSSEPNLQPGSKPQVHINMIISRLEGVSKSLKSRDTIRELASIDILLNDMGIASHFPELTDAQAKLIEAFGYASNKVEAVIAKLRGSGTARPSPAQQQQPTPPIPATIQTAPIAPKQEKVNTEELRSKPIGKVQRELPKE